MIYSRNSRVLGDVCSPALGLLVPECNVALALHLWLNIGSRRIFTYNMGYRCYIGYKTYLTAACFDAAMLHSIPN